MDPFETVAHLQKVAGFFEVYHVTTFTCFRERRDGGGTQEVTVSILDAGPSKPDLRYHVSAKSNDGKSATGNPAERLDVALALVHWGDLG